MRQTLTDDPWLSSQMGLPCYQLQHAKALTIELQEEISRLLLKRSFITAKVPSASVKLVGQLEEIGFHIVDTAVTLEANSLATKTVSRFNVRDAKSCEQSRIEEIARNSFNFTRFHLDPRIDRTTASHIKAQWSANFFRRRRGNFMIVAERNSIVCGFCLLLLEDSAKTLTIDLIAVDKSYRGAGAATDMIHFSPLSHSALRRRVSTQIANIPSLRLYEKAGYRIAKSTYILHAHGRQN